MARRSREDRAVGGPQQRHGKAPWKLGALVAGLLAVAAVILVIFSLDEGSRPQGPQLSGNHRAVGQSGPLTK